MTVHLVFEEIYSWKEERLLFIVRSLACKVKPFPPPLVNHWSPFLMTHSLICLPSFHCCLILSHLLTNLHVSFCHVYLLDSQLPTLYIPDPSGSVYKESWLTKRHRNSASDYKVQRIYVSEGTSASVPLFWWKHCERGWEALRIEKCTFMMLQIQRHSDVGCQETKGRWSLPFQPVIRCFLWGSRLYLLN